MKKQLSRVLFIVRAGRKDGLGHLKRCLTIAKSGEHAFSSIFAVIGDYDRSEMMIPYDVVDIETVYNLDNVDLIFLDCRDTTPGFTKKLIKIAPVVSLDDHGRGSGRSIVSILSLPVLKSNVKANYYGEKYIVLDPLLQDFRKDRIKREDYIVLSFGGSDPNNLTEKVANVLLKDGHQLKIIKGPMNLRDYSHLDAEVYTDPENFFEIIAKARLLITSFGMTFFESLYLGTPVVLYNHSKYHYRLSLNYDVPNAGYAGFEDNSLGDRLGRIIGDYDMMVKSIEKYSKLVDLKGADRISGIIKSTINAERKDCLFNHTIYSVVKRTQNYSISRCSRCGDLFLTGFSGKGNRYSKDYFLDEYEKQYGKSYLEDRSNIKKLGLGRLKTIEKFNPEKGRLLDIGCALGFFVKLARDRGWDAEGIEVSDFAVDWAIKNLNIRVYRGDFLDLNLESGYSAITIYFVLEHFKNPLMAVRKVYNLLKPGGVLAIAIPSRGGILYRMNRREFLDSHPDDHYFDTTPGNLKRFLAGFGFKVVRIKATGIHPERFFSVFGLKKVPGILKMFYRVVAKIFRLGDTFELYAVKR